MAELAARNLVAALSAGGVPPSPVNPEVRVHSGF
jgi:hypothetical protein